jgi:hypothetical protein
VVLVTPIAMSSAAQKFDTFAAQIESSRARERALGSVLGGWINYSTDDSTCVACDFQVVCPDRTTPISPPASDM